MKFRLMGVGLLAVAALLSACDKKSSDNKASEPGPAQTPQTYPAPGLTFYSQDVYKNVPTDRSYYFGGRTAYLYYLGAVPFNGRNAVVDCTEVMRAGNNGMPPLASSSLGGFQNRWKARRTQRYNQVHAARGDRFAQVQKWYTQEGNQPLTQLYAGSYLVCLLDRNGTHDGMGFYFEANAQMTPNVNVNMGFQDYQVQFSQCYFGSEFQGNYQANARPTR